MAESQRERAKRLYLESGGKKTLRTIAEELGVPLPTVKAWKQRDDWDAKDASVEPQKDASKPPKDASEPKREKGGQQGNQNASGHRNSSPEGNRYALKTGEYERIMFETLTPEEVELARSVRTMDKYELLVQELALLTVREKRIMEYIHVARAYMLNPSPPTSPGMVAMSAIITKFEGKGESSITSENVLLLLTQLEDALTRVQQRKQVAIDALHKYQVDDRRYMAQHDEQTAPEDDPLSAALMELAGELDADQ